ncbi:MAG: aminopeptidase [Phycisphaerae bacterium]|nr:aminopeptidase [Phycisphaerae bacterium]
MKRRLVIRLLTVVLSAGLVTGLGGCGCNELGYVTSAALGELDLLLSAVPIEQGLDDPTLDDEAREKLQLVLLARDYAEEVIGLNVGNSYRTFVNLHGEPLAWNLSASRKDAIEAYYWRLPVVGPISYLGYFEFDQVEAERDRLVELGYDTFIYELDAYSTLGWLPDPVTSAMFRRGIISLVDTVIHELLHNTIYRADNPVFSESLAVFVGRTGAIEFLGEQFGEGSDWAQRAGNTYQDSDRFNLYLAELRAELETLYGSDLGREEIIQARQPVFENARTRIAEELLPELFYPESYEPYTTVTLNNAFLLVNVRYNSDLELFEEVFELVDRDWKRALAVFRQAAAASSPFAYMDRWVSDHSVGG